MFDRYNLGSPFGNLDARVDVTEKRAPTDDSIRLYGEMLEKARSEVVRHLALPNELANFGAVTVNHGLVPKVVMLFKLNGKEYRCEAPIDHLHTWDRVELMNRVLQKMAEAIVAELLKSDGYRLFATK